MGKLLTIHAYSLVNPDNSIVTSFHAPSLLAASHLHPTARPNPNRARGRGGNCAWKRGRGTIYIPEFLNALQINPKDFLDRKLMMAYHASTSIFLETIQGAMIEQLAFENGLGPTFFCFGNDGIAKYGWSEIIGKLCTFCRCDKATSARKETSLFCARDRALLYFHIGIILWKEHEELNSHIISNARKVQTSCLNCHFQAKLSEMGNWRKCYIRWANTKLFEFGKRCLRKHMQSYNISANKYPWSWYDMAWCPYARCCAAIFIHLEDATAKMILLQSYCSAGAVLETRLKVIHWTVDFGTVKDFDVILQGK
eukprot:Gb_20240 [translate_table: standard]